MIELAEIYLGNITENSNLSEQIEKSLSEENCIEVYLTQTDSGKGRIHTHSSSEIEIGIIKGRDWVLREGDVFKTEQNKLVLIHLQKQKIMVLSFTQPISDRAMDLIHLGHVLGNHHWPIIVQGQKIYVQLTADEDVIEETILNFKIPGLRISYEWRSPSDQLTFSEHDHHDHY